MHDTQCHCKERKVRARQQAIQTYNEKTVYSSRAAHRRITASNGIHSKPAHQIARLSRPHHLSSGILEPSGQAHADLIN